MFHAISYADLWSEWAARPTWWAAEHVEALRNRYAVSL